MLDKKNNKMINLSWTKIINLYFSFVSLHRIFPVVSPDGRAFVSGERWFPQHYLRRLLSPGRDDSATSLRRLLTGGFPGSV